MNQSISIFRELLNRFLCAFFEQIDQKHQKYIDFGQISGANWNASCCFSMWSRNTYAIYPDWPSWTYRSGVNKQYCDSYVLRSRVHSVSLCYDRPLIIPIHLLKKSIFFKILWKGQIFHLFLNPFSKHGKTPCKSSSANNYKRITSCAA